MVKVGLSTAFAIPKSVRTTRSSGPSKMLAGFTSRCTTPASCAARSPARTPRPIRATSSRRQRPVIADRVTQRPERHEFHHDGRPAIIVDDVVHADHVRVAEPRGHLRLSHRAAAAGFPLSILHLRRQDDLLDRHIPGEQFVAGPPDHAHPAAADDGTKPVPSGKKASWLRLGHFRRLPKP